MGSADCTVVEVLSAQQGFIAGFASVLEACRYAALLCEPSHRPLLRRATDGALLAFDPATPAAEVARWAEARPSASATPAAGEPCAATAAAP